MFSRRFRRPEMLEPRASDASEDVAHALRSSVAIGCLRRSDVGKYALAFLLLIFIPSGSLAARSPVPVSEYADYHIAGGALQPNIRDEAMCKIRCGQTEWCLALDFDFSTLTCWFHATKTACKRLLALPGAKHYKYIDCLSPLRQNINRVAFAALKDVAAVVSRINHIQAKPVVSPNAVRLPAPVLSAPGVATCGRPAIPPTGSRIIGGDEARPHSWPWQVALRNINARSSRCAGTLIAPQWVLTTAHCVDQDQTASNWFVLAGAHDLLQLESSRAVHAVSRIIIHERFDLSTFNNDIALLRLAVPVQFNARMSPVCLPPPNSVLAEGTRCVIVGWGVAANGRRRLKQATVPVVSLSTCRRPDWLGLEFTLTDNMMCAGYETGGIDTCQGDSGGPLVCYVNNVWVQAGVTSFGRGCGMPRKPGVYTMVSRYVSWIQSNVNTF